jgi:hypothetical protein
VIALLWSSVRILSGDAALAPELEALDMAARGVDVLSSRRKMLLRALKDLENERAIGKLDDDDYLQISAVYREDLKAVLKRIDDSLAPHRARARRSRTRPPGEGRHRGRRSEGEGGRESLRPRRSRDARESKPHHLPELCGVERARREVLQGMRDQAWRRRQGRDLR